MTAPPQNIFAPVEKGGGNFGAAAASLTIPLPAANVLWLGAKRDSVGDKQLVR
jgi:hypothetical protein